MQQGGLDWNYVCAPLSYRVHVMKHWITNIRDSQSVPPLDSKPWGRTRTALLHIPRVHCIRSVQIGHKTWNEMEMQLRAVLHSHFERSRAGDTKHNLQRARQVAWHIKRNTILKITHVHHFPGSVNTSQDSWLPEHIQNVACTIAVIRFTNPILR
jgi:hypothetical protein